MEKSLIHETSILPKASLIKHNKTLMTMCGVFGQKHKHTMKLDHLTPLVAFVCVFRSCPAVCDNPER